MRVFTVFSIFALIWVGTPPAYATPSSTYWAPSTAGCQAWKVPHVTYDTYFGRGPSPGNPGSPAYPVDTGLTMGVVPSDKIQSEVGFDLLLPTPDPYALNGKLCTTESAWFEGSPGVGVGIYEFGFSTGVNDYDVLYAILQKTIPGMGGYIAFGVYHGMSQTLFTNSDGNVVRTGLIAGVFSPDIPIGLKGLKKINIGGDIQTGKNVLGAFGAGPYFYFTDNISLSMGPVFFLDPALQPGQRSALWTMQLDVDVPL